MQSVMLFLCESCALFLALGFLRVRFQNKIMISLGLGALGAILCGAFGYWHLGVPVSVTGLLLSLVAVFMLRGLEDTEWRYVWMMFFLCVGMTETLMMAGKSFGVCVSERLALPFVFVICVVSLWLSQMLLPIYPQQGFLDDLEEQNTEKKHRYVPLIPMFLFVLQAAVSTGGAILFRQQGVTGIAAAFLLYLLYWAAAGLVSVLAKSCRMSSAVMSEKQYRAEMETFMNVIRSQRHDYNFHVQTIAGILRQNDLEACKKYIGELQQDSMEMNEVLPLHDPAISATIYNFRGLAAREGIRLHIDIQNDLSRIVTNVYETNKIISNLLQNALDEVKTHEDKSYGIRLYILKRGQYCVIHTVNETAQAITAEGVSDIYRRGYTTKSGHDGVGLSSIKSLAERNHGLVYTRIEGNRIHFVAKIPMRYE